MIEEIKAGDEVIVREKSRKLETIHGSLRRMREGRILPWLALDKASLKGVLLEIPSRQDIPENVNENLIVELYSK